MKILQIHLPNFRAQCKEGSNDGFGAPFALGLRVYATPGGNSINDRFSLLVGASLGNVNYFSLSLNLCSNLFLQGKVTIPLEQPIT